MNWRAWIPAAIAAVLGFGLGLFYAWNLNPVRYTETAPASLKPEYQQEYLVLIAAAYRGTGNLERAEARLALFDHEEPVEELEALAQERLAQEGGEDEARALAQLAGDLAQSPFVQGSPSPPRPGSPPPTTRAATPTASATVRPTIPPSATPTPGPPFELVERQVLCPERQADPLLQVQVEDAQGDPVPGVQVRVLWAAGEDRFFTGLKPELGLGYGDFRLEPDVLYTVQLAEGAVPVTDLRSEPCPTGSGESFPGTIFLRFRQPGS
jgi:hypothetical protein